MPTMRLRDLDVDRLLQSIHDAVIAADPGSGRIVLWNRAAEALFGYSASEALGLPIDVLVPERLKAQLGAALAQASATGQRTVSRLPLELVALRKTGEVVPIEIALTPVDAPFVLAVVRETAERKGAEERLAARNRELLTLYRISEITLHTPSLTAAFEEIVEEISAATGFPSVAIEIYDEARQMMVFKGVKGVPVPVGETDFEVPVEETLSGIVARTGQSLVETRALARPEYANATLRRLGVQTFVCVPMTASGQVIGALSLAHPEAIPLDERLVQWAASLANYVAARIKRQQVEEALRASEERFRHMFVQSKDAMFVVDPAQDRILDANPSACSLLGYSREELLSTPVSAIHPNEMPKLQTLARSVAEHGRGSTDEFTCLTKTGQSLPCEISASLVDVGGRSCMMACVRDLTERKRMEEALRFLAESSALLAATLDYEATLASVARLAVPFLADLCIVDVVEGDQSIRRMAVAAADPAKEELAHALRRYPPDPNAAEGVPKVLRTGRAEIVPEISDSWLISVAQDVDHLRILGAVSPRSNLIVPLLARGRTLGAITFVSAESGREYSPADLPLAKELASHAALAVDNARLYQAAREAVRARAAERDRLQQVLDVLPEGIVIVDTTGQVVMSNVAALEILGQLPPGANADSLFSPPFGYYRPRLIDGSPYPLEELPLVRSVLHGEVVRAEQFCICNARDGRVIPVLVNSAPLRDSAGAIVGGVAVFQDITAIKDFERARDDFLSAASHDLKNPLGVIKGYAQRLQRLIAQAHPVEMAQVLEGLAKIDATASRMAALINELLDVARLQAGQPLDLDRRLTDLVALARRVADEHQKITERHHIRVEAAVAEMVSAWDPVRLERVLANLISNAIKYSPTGGAITVTLARQPGDAGDWAVLGVQDEGLGIPAADLPHVFDRFHRAANVAGRIGGTGIGLASARKIVEQHGGTITVVSEEGAGATFTVRLPLMAGDRSSLATTGN